MQLPKPSNKLTVVLLSVALVGSALALGGAAMAQEETTQAESDQDPQQTTYLRVAHASPDAPSVNVLVENETVLSDVPFGAVSDYLTLESGTYNVTITAAEDPDTVVFEGEITLEPRTANTLAASGEVSEGAETAFEPVGYEDDALTPAENESAVRVAHLAPDAPAVDVTAADGDVVLADNVTFQNASEYVTVPAGDYTVEVRAATADNNGSVVTTANVSLDGGTAYSALAVGYLEPENAPADTPFEVVLTGDATSTVQLPSAEEPNGETPTEEPTEEPTETATEEPTETATEEPAGTATEEPTEEPAGTATEEPTETATSDA